MNQITICENPLEPSTWRTYPTNDVCAFLVEYFNGKWPKTAHIFLEHVARNSDITPYDDAGIERISKIQKGNFFVVVFPEGIELIVGIVAIAIAAVAVGLAFLLRPSLPGKNQDQNSANNLLGNRQNTARPGARIPDIFGQLWATFDLLAVPYRLFENNVEVEHCYMCVGRGSYQFETLGGLTAIRDDMTLLEQIDGAGVNVFGPGNNPNNGASSDFSLGKPFTEPVVNLTIFTGVNGQLLQAPNRSSINQIEAPGPLLRAVYPNVIQQIGLGALDLTLAFSAGDLVYLGGAVPNDSIFTDSGGQPSLDLGGVYVCSSVDATHLYLDSPATVNPNWTSLAAFNSGASGQSNFSNCSVQANTPFWIGGNTAIGIDPFWVNHPEADQIWCNFVAMQGSYKVDVTTGDHFTVDTVIQVEVTPCDTSGTASGSSTLTSVTLHGSQSDQQPKGVSLKINITPGTGGVLVRAHRISDSETGSNWQVADDVQWRDLYVVTDVCATSTIDFGDVTTIQTLIRATPSALAVKERKMNALVTRKVQVPFGSALAASTNAADILCSMANDPFIGNMQASEIDDTNIYDVAGSGGDIETYFASVDDPTLLTQFSYTFDDASMSFEEMAVQLAQDILCVAYRRGGLLSLSFEKQTSDSVVLFNHRNKIPKSELRTVTFGPPTGNDGVILDYVEPNAPNFPNVDSTVSLYFPPDRSATNPRKISTIGIRNLQQAMVLGWRLYWKMVAQNTAVQFDCTEEAALLVLQDRILVADNTRQETQDGEVVAQSSLLLTLSQKVVFVGGHTYKIFLQHYDGTVESIAITAGGTDHQVTLGTAPALPCVTDQTKFAKTTYMIVDNADTATKAFLLTEKRPKEGKQFELKAVNYSDQYYQHDLDIVDPTEDIFSPCASPPVTVVQFKKFSPQSSADLTMDAPFTIGNTIVVLVAGSFSLYNVRFNTTGGTLLTRVNKGTFTPASTSMTMHYMLAVPSSGVSTLHVDSYDGLSGTDIIAVYELTPCDSYDGVNTTGAVNTYSSPLTSGASANTSTIQAPSSVTGPNDSEIYLSMSFCLTQQTSCACSSTSFQPAHSSTVDQGFTIDFDEGLSGPGTARGNRTFFNCTGGGAVAKQPTVTLATPLWSCGANGACVARYGGWVIWTFAFGKT